MNSWEFKAALKLLSRLGLTANYTGFYHASYAVALAFRDPSRLLFVTKCLYPDVATQFSTKPKCVERNIRTVAALAWERNPSLLCEMAEFQLSKKPSNTEFLAILTTYLSSGKLSV